MTEILCPTCPMCDQPPEWMFSPQQVFCENPECPTFNWDATKTKAHLRTQPDSTEARNSGERLVVDDPVELYRIAQVFLMARRRRLAGTTRAHMKVHDLTNLFGPDEEKP